MGRDPGWFVGSALGDAERERDLERFHDGKRLVDMEKEPPASGHPLGALTLAKLQPRNGFGIVVNE